MLSLREGKKMIDYYVKKGCDGVIFTGGEPTLSENLPLLMQYTSGKKVPYRLITNGQKFADLAYLKSLKDAGLEHVHVSIYSVREKVQDFLTRTPGSWKNVLKALENLGRVGTINTDINIVINHYNADHLLENAQFLVKHFPFVHHFVWNNLDPTTPRARRHKDTWPTLNEFELSLHRAMVFLAQAGRTFRVERIPLCYLLGFEYTSTEARKIVKQENRRTFFLDKRGLLEEEDWLHKWGYSQGKACESCFLNTMCLGLFHRDHCYHTREIYPVFADKKEIIRQIYYGK